MYVPVKSNEVRMVGVHVGELYLYHQLNLRRREGEGGGEKALNNLTYKYL